MAFRVYDGLWSFAGGPICPGSASPSSPPVFAGQGGCRPRPTRPTKYRAGGRASATSSGHPRSFHFEELREDQAPRELDRWRSGFHPLVFSLCEKEKELLDCGQSMYPSNHRQFEDSLILQGCVSNHRPICFRPSMEHHLAVLFKVIEGSLPIDVPLAIWHKAPPDFAYTASRFLLFTPKSEDEPSRSNHRNGHP